MRTWAVPPAEKWSRMVLAAAVVTAVVIAFAPLGGSVTCYEGVDGDTGCTSHRINVYSVDGNWILEVGLLLVLVSAVPAVRPRPGLMVAAAVVLTVVLLEDTASVGMWFGPLVVVAWIAAAVASISSRAR